MEFKDYLRILQRRWIAVLVITLAVGGSSWFVVQSEPTLYRARADIAIGENPFIFSGDTPALFTDYYNKATRVAFIRSRQVLEAAILERPEAEKYFAEVRRDPTRLNDEVLALRESIEIQQDKDIDVYSVMMTSRDPERAVALVNAVAEAFNVVSKRRQEQGIENAIKFIDEQLKLKEAEAAEIGKQLKELGPGPAEGVLGLDEKRLLAEIAALEKRKNEKRVEIDSLDAGLAILNAQLERPETLPAVPVPDGELQSIREHLDKKKLDLQSMSQRYTDSYQGIRKLKEEIEALKVQYSEALDRQTKFADYLAQRGLIDQIRAKGKEKRKVLAELEGTSRLLDAAGVKLADILARGPDDPTKRELANQEKRIRARARLEGLELSRRGLEDRRLRLNENKRLIVSSAEALEPSRQAAPLPKRGTRTIPLMALAGLIVGVASAFLLEYLNTTIRTEHDVKRYVNLPIFGIVGRIKSEAERLLVNAAPRSPLSEVFNTIGAMVESHAQQAGAKVFMVASSNAGEGKSTITSNLAVALARGGSRVILVDADLRKAVLHKFFNVENEVGLSTHLLGAHPAAAGEGEAPAPVEIHRILKPTEVENLMVVTAGPHPKNPVSLLKSEGFRALIADLRTRADIVLVDVPPVRIAVDTLVLSPQVDGIVVLVSAGETNKDDVAFAKRLIEAARGKMVGCILNKVTIQSRGYYYYYYYYDSYKYYRET